MGFATKNRLETEAKLLRLEEKREEKKDLP